MVLLPFKISAASTAMDLVKPNNPALEAAYVTVPVIPFNASNEETLIMHLDNDDGGDGDATVLSVVVLLDLFFSFRRARIHAFSIAREV